MGVSAQAQRPTTWPFAVIGILFAVVAFLFMMRVLAQHQRVDRLEQQEAQQPDGEPSSGQEARTAPADSVAGDASSIRY